MPQSRNTAAVPAKSASAAPAKRQVIKLHVNFTLNTPDGKRRVNFDLEKDKADNGVINWKITFQLFERAKATSPFGDAIVSLLVEVDTKLGPQAQAVFEKGLTPPQSAHAIGPAADVAKDPDVDDDTKREMVQGTLTQTA